MKRLFLILITLFLCSVELSAQHAFGVRGGAGSSTVAFMPLLETRMTDIKSTFGVSYRYRGGDKFVGGIEVDLNYVETGYKYMTGEDYQNSYERSLQQIELPFLWQPHVAFGKKDNVSFFLNAGPYVGMTLGSSNITYKENGVVKEEIDYEFDAIKDNVFNYGIMGGAGVGARFGKIEVIAEFRYVYGLSDVLKNPTKYNASSFTESPLSQMNVTVGVYYNFIKLKK
ncbi:MAG: porin family protein [Rikenellaceae bacterium]